MDLINLINPQHIIPSHGPASRLKPMLELGKDLGYKSGKQIHLMHDGKKLRL